MTPQELHAALDARRQALRVPWWVVAVDLDITEDVLHKLRHGVPSPAVAARAPAWLEGR